MSKSQRASRRRKPQRRHATRARAVPASTALVRQAEADAALVASGSDPAKAMYLLARDPHVGVDKLERLIALQERIMAHNAKAAFDSAFTIMQSELPEIDEKGRITVKGQLRSTYAKLEDITKVVRPILKARGFAIRHRTEWPIEKPGIMRIVGILSHEQGHREESAFEAAADESDYRTDIQSQGSTVSYGRRYTTIDLLNITTRGQDNDGQGRVDTEQRVVSYAKPKAPITQPQRQRLWVLIKRSGRAETEVKMWLKARYGLDSTRDLTRDIYDEVCTAVEGSAPLAVDREPGSDDQ